MTILKKEHAKKALEECLDVQSKNKSEFKLFNSTYFWFFVAQINYR